MCHAIRAEGGVSACLANIVGSVSRWSARPEVFGRPRGTRLSRPCRRRPAAGRGPVRSQRVRSLQLLEEHERETNFIARSFARSVIAATTSTAATVRDTPPSVAGLATVFGAAGGRARTRRVKRPISYYCGDRTRARRTRSSFTICSRACGTAHADVRRRSATDELRAVGGALGGARCGLGHRARQRDRPRDQSPRGLEHREFIENATTGFEDYRRESSLHARLRGARDRRAGRHDSHDGARVRARPAAP